MGTGKSNLLIESDRRESRLTYLLSTDLLPVISLPGNNLALTVLSGLGPLISA